MQNQPAFPMPAFYHEGGAVQIPNDEMDIRTYIATAAMQGMLSACNGVDSTSQSQEWIAKISVTQADALIAELQKTK